MLGWLEPRVVSRADALRVTLPPASPLGDVLIVMPGANGSDPFAEYYMLEYCKSMTGNDENFPGNKHFLGPGGLVIWHVDFRWVPRVGPGFYASQDLGAACAVRVYTSAAALLVLVGALCALTVGWSKHARAYGASAKHTPHPTG